jgi:outer membrane protein TolC
MKKIIGFILLSYSLFSQDSLMTLRSDEVLLMVQKYHPIVKQAFIGVQISQANILAAKGNFDPVFSQYASQKTLDGKNYYTYQSPHLAIPTWYGIEISGGIEFLNGYRINPDQSLGQTSYIGISVPLARNLVMDRRRATLIQAKIFNQVAIQEQRNLINQIIVDVMSAYWNWVKTYRVYETVKQNLKVAEDRQNLTKKGFELGERPAIDTVEAASQQQYFSNITEAKWLEFQNATLDLSAFLWGENNIPIQIPHQVNPSESLESIQGANFSLSDLIDVAMKNHPELQVYSLKISALQVDKKLKFQGLLPKIDLQYNQIASNQATFFTGSLFENNFLYGLKVEIPLRFSQGRAEYQKAKLKLQDESLFQDQKRRSLELKIKSYYNELIALRKQILTQESTNKNLLALVKAEESRFFNGESSLFLINSRENKALEALEKLIELKTKFAKTVYALQGSAGILGGV